jgi:hypothetical protein
VRRDRQRSNARHLGTQHARRNNLAAWCAERYRDAIAEGHGNNRRKEISLGRGWAGGVHAGGHRLLICAVTEAALNLPMLKRIGVDTALELHDRRSVP